MVIVHLTWVNEQEVGQTSLVHMHFAKKAFTCFKSRICKHACIKILAKKYIYIFAHYVPVLLLYTPAVYYILHLCYLVHFCVLPLRKAAAKHPAHSFSCQKLLTGEQLKYDSHIYLHVVSIIWIFIIVPALVAGPWNSTIFAETSLGGLAALVLGLWSLHNGALPGRWIPYPPPFSFSSSKELSLLDCRENGLHTWPLPAFFGVWFCCFWGLGAILL